MSNIIVLDLVLGFGLISIVFTTLLGRTFWRGRHIHPLLRDAAIMAWTLTLISICTFMFGFAAWMGEYVNLPGWFMNTLRVIIFGSSIGACVKVNYTLQSLRLGK